MTATRDSTIAARIPHDLREDLERVARAAGVDLSTIIRIALRDHADRHTANGLVTGPIQRADLFNPAPGPARRTDPPTSKTAAAMVAPRTGSQRRRALEIIRDAGPRGRTADEVIATLEVEATRQGRRGPAVNGIARRITDLKQAGAITPAPHPFTGLEPPLTRPTRNGTPATVYVITAAGAEWLEQNR